MDAQMAGPRLREEEAEASHHRSPPAEHGRKQTDEERTLGLFFCRSKASRNDRSDS